MSINIDDLINLYSRSDIKIKLPNQSNSNSIIRRLKMGEAMVAFFKDIKSGEKPKDIKIKIDKDSIDELMNRYHTKSVIHIYLPAIGNILPIILNSKTNFGATNIVCSLQGATSRIDKSGKLRPCEPDYKVVYLTKESEFLNEHFPCEKQAKSVLKPLSYTIGIGHSIVDNLFKTHDIENYVTYTLFEKNSNVDIDELAKICRMMRLKPGVLVLYPPKFNGGRRLTLNYLKLLKALGL